MKLKKGISVILIMSILITGFTKQPVLAVENMTKNGQVHLLGEIQKLDEEANKELLIYTKIQKQLDKLGETENNQTYVELGDRNLRTTPSAILIDEEIKTDRFIIKFKDKKRREEFKDFIKNERKISEEMDNVSAFKFKQFSDFSNKNENGKTKYEKFLVLTMENEIKTNNLMEQLKVENIDSEIEYIQPDYEITLSSNNLYYENQCGLENTQNEIVQDDAIVNEEMLCRIPPHLREILNRNPGLMEIILFTPKKELIDKILTGDIPGDTPPEMLMELALNPVIQELQSRDELTSQTYLCDEEVTGEWKNTFGKGTIVAVIDTGIDIKHENLRENIWMNPNEIPDNGIDDDGNGYVDDSYGWNFADDNNIVFDSDNANNEKHGTYIAGIVAAEKGNDIDVAETAPETKVMPLKAFKDGTAYTSDIIEAIEYAKNMDVKIVNCSWGSKMYNPALEETMKNSDMLFVRAAGNSRTNIDENLVTTQSSQCDILYTVQCSENQKYNLIIVSQNIQDNSQYMYTVYYNPSDFEISDICALTNRKETSAEDLSTGIIPGLIKGTDIEITKLSLGLITFRKTGTIEPGKAWTGSVNCITFRSLNSD